MPRYTPPPKAVVKSSFSAQLGAMLDFHRIDLVLDVGANRGQYARKLRELGYQGDIFSFEPQQDVRDLAAKAAADDPRWTVFPAMAVSDRQGKVTLQRSAEDDMSSLHDQTELHQSVSPSSAILHKETVESNRLDTILSGQDVSDRRIMLKSDTQGHESRVLDGLGDWLAVLQMIQLELPLSPLYEDAVPWNEVVDRLGKAGYELHGLKPGYFERKVARLLEFDAVFVRPI